MDCFRCQKEINHPNSGNADYIIAPDIIINEDCERLIALVDVREDTPEKTPAEELDDNDEGFEAYDVTGKVKAVEDSLGTKLVADIPEGTVRCVSRIKSIPIQKTGIVCPDCYDEKTDTLIWGIHKA